MLTYIRRNLKYAYPWNWKSGIKALYRRFSRSGIFFSNDDLGMSSLTPTLKVEKIVQLARPRTVLDVGCGTGQTVMQLQQLGIDVLGIEGSRVAVRRSPREDLILRLDLRKKIELHRFFDLVWCFEVAEHIHPRYVHNFIGNLVRHSEIIALSAAPPGQGGEGHFNEQPQSYWEQKFSDYGYILHHSWTAEMKAVQEFYSENMMVFTSRKLPN
jgi:2-polyprenyl-3-methyl-5-hydroxy-6-metoxy-1,4-benzoquinol methylase